MQTDTHDGIEGWSDLAATVIFKGILSGHSLGKPPTWDCGSNTTRGQGQRHECFVDENASGYCLYYEGSTAIKSDGQEVGFEANGPGVELS